MSMMTLDMVSMNGSAPEMARKGNGAAHYMRAVPAVLGSFDVNGICGTSMGNTTDASVVIGTELDAPLCKRCAGIYARLVAADADVQDTPAPADADETPDADAVTNASVVVLGDVTESTPGNTDRVQAALDAANKARPASAPTAEQPKIGDALSWEYGRGEYVWATAEGEGADYIALSALRETMTGDGHVYVLHSGDRWHAGTSVPVIDAELYVHGDTPDDAVSGVVYRAKIVAGMRERAAVAERLPVDPGETAIGRQVAVARERGRLSRQAAEREITRADAARLSGDKPSANAEADAVKDVESGQAAKREGQAVAVARATDGKCAAEVSQEDGTTVLVTLSGRMALDKITPIAEAIGAEIIPVGKAAGALAPVPGSDADGITGVCPLCHEAVKLTNSGAVGTHRNGGATPDAPQLSQREIPAVDRRGEPTRDASKRRESEAYVKDCTVTLPGDAPVADQVAAVLAAVAGVDDAPGVAKTLEPVVEHASAAPVGVRDHGRSDGVAMVPLGQTGYAGVKFDDGETFTVDGKSVKSVDGVKVKAPMVSDVVGGYFGYLTEAQYQALGKNARRNYRRKVAQNEAKFRAGKRAQRAKAIENGLALTAAERRQARERAALGSRDEGFTRRGAHMATRHTDTAVVTVGSDVVRVGR